MIIHWFRRDLRLYDNVALSKALEQGAEVLPIFIFDKHILSRLEDKDDARVNFIHKTLYELKCQLNQRGSDLRIFFGDIEQVWREILNEIKPSSVYANEDYEPYARKRDDSVRKILFAKNVPLNLFKDQVIFHKDDILKSDGKPYTVFTPYSRKWKAMLTEEMTQSRDLDFSKLKAVKPSPFPSLKSIGFDTNPLKFNNSQFNHEVISNYHKHRDIPSLGATTLMSVHLRFGTVSIRECVRKGLTLNETWLNELIWRSFFSQILYHFPEVVENNFRPKYNFIKWRNNTEEFEKWKMGKTGFPLVDAGMRELNSTGFMHNRVRMVTAAFLCKQLLIDWRWGEAYFAQKLLDYDLASNNGNWQWAAGTGSDAAPYFRIFNPMSQLKKFDSQEKYCATWIPELGTSDYPKPMLDLAMARTRCLDAYKVALNAQL
jgi:deoxyribodipyrimidine photo-lyase